MVPSGTVLSVGEQGPEKVWVGVYPFSAPSKGSNGGGGGMPTIHIYLDSKEISKQTVKRVTQEIATGRSR
jgi:hypothetical protein